MTPAEWQALTEWVIDDSQQNIVALYNAIALAKHSSIQVAICLAVAIVDKFDENDHDQRVWLVNEFDGLRSRLLDGKSHEERASAILMALGEVTHPKIKEMQLHIAERFANCQFSARESTELMPMMLVYTAVLVSQGKGNTLDPLVRDQLKKNDPTYIHLFAQEPLVRMESRVRSTHDLPKKKKCRTG